MKIAFLTTRLDKPSSRYRILQYIPFLKEAGIETRVFVYPKNLWSRLRLWDFLDPYDCVILHRKLPGMLDLHFLRKKSKK